MRKLKKIKLFQILSVFILSSLAVVFIVINATQTPTQANSSVDMPAELQPEGTFTNGTLSSRLADPVEATDPGLLSSVRFIDSVSLHLGGSALDDQGAVWMWGYNAYGMQGIGMAQEQGGTHRYQGGMKRIPYFTDNNIKIKRIWGTFHTMYAQDENNTMYAWGYGLWGNMGNGSSGASATNNTLPVVMTGVPAGETVKEMYIGPELAHAVYMFMESGNVYVLGSRYAQRIPNSFLPNGSGSAPGVSGDYVSLPQYVAPLTDLNKSDPIVSMGLGDFDGMVSTESGKVYAWGRNANGQLGTGNLVPNYNLHEIAYFRDRNLKVKQVSANYDDSLVLLENGDVYNFGNIKGAHYTISNVTTPTLVEVDLTSANYTPIFQSVHAGRYGEMAVDQYGRLWAWGSNMRYQYGTDGPSWGTTDENTLFHFDDPSYGKLGKRLIKATQVLTVLGDGDTEFRAPLGAVTNPNMPVKAPVFDNLSGTNQVYQFTETLSKWRSAGMWSNQLLPAAGSGNRHPTIYDKRYYETTGNLLDLTTPSPTDAQKANSHDKVYFVDKEGRKLVYVVLSTGNNRYSANFYVAEDSYSGSWFVNRSGITDLYGSTASSTLPDGVTTETSLPQVKDDEQGWIEAVTGGKPNDFTGTQNVEAPYAAKVFSFQSNLTILDKSGNLYRSALDGSGTIAWGWDYIPQYEWNGAAHNYQDGKGIQARHAVDGLFDMYSYELMFMRGAPRINPTTTDITSPVRKIYKSEANQNQNTNVRITLGTAVVNDQLNITIEPELTQAKYIKIPFDPNDPNTSITEPTQEQFEAAYNGSNGYEKDDLITLNGWTADDLINKSPDTSKRLSDNEHIVVTDNCVLWVMTVTHGYSADVADISRTVYDNYYTDTTVYHDGENIASPFESIYAATNKYIAKTEASKDSEDEDMSIYGLPLDKNGKVIQNPTFGYDEVTIRAFASTDPEYNQYIAGWYLPDSVTTPVNKTLDSLDYLESAKYTHTFLYERDPAGWVTITYRGRLTGSTEDISPYSLDGLEGNDGISGNKETVKKSTASVNITLTRTPADVEGSNVENFAIDGGARQNLTAGKVQFNTISARDINTMEVIIYYSRAELFVRQVIVNTNNDLIVPSQGYFTLNNTDGTVTGNRYNLKVNSGNTNTVPFQRAQLKLEADKHLYTISPVMPGLYQYYGYRISTTEANHEAANLELAPNRAAIDFSKESTQYVTIYLEPSVKTSEDIPFFNWDYQLNEFGKILKP